VPPSSVLDEKSLTSLLQQLPPPFILMGDFNAHHPLWGRSKLNLRGQVVENILLHNNIPILNSKQSTYIYPATGSLSNINLTLCSPSIAIDFSWNLQSDTYGSDYFPIFLSTNKSTSSPYLQYWKINKADWPKFSQSCEHSVDNNISTIEQFSDTLVTIANKTIPKTGISSYKIKNPWFTEECKKACKLRQKALRTLKAHPTSTNI